jgi:Rrf2 family protein
MAANSRMATAIQILCVMAYRGEGMTSEIIAHSLRTNAVVVRRLLKNLEAAGLVEIRPGKDGGVELLKAPDEISLDLVYQAVEADAEIFALRQSGNGTCRINRGMKVLLPPLFEEVGTAVENVLGRTTIESLLRSIP